MVALLVLSVSEWTRDAARFRLRTIRRSISQPRWLYMLLLFWLVLTYSYSGWTKLYYNGLSWADGYGLQLTVFLYCPQPGFFASLLLAHSELAGILQKIVLGCEVFSLAALFSLNFRRAWCLMLFGFHLTSLFLLGSEFDFVGNIALLAMIGAYGQDFTSTPNA